MTIASDHRTPSPASPTGPSGPATSVGALRELTFRVGLRLRHAAFGPRGEPGDALDHVLRHAPGHAVLQSVTEWQRARKLARRLGLPVHPDPPKSWDTLLAVAAVLRHAPRDGRIVDAGGERYSVLLPTLHLYGYRDLRAINPAFRRTYQRGPIDYIPGDATRTGWADRTVHAITCLSVVEHGVDLDALFAEAARLLVPGGALVISTDYWPVPVDTGGRSAYGVPIKIFTSDELLGWIARAAGHGLVPAGDFPARRFTAIPGERAVIWRRFGLRYTFAFITFQRR